MVDSDRGDPSAVENADLTELRRIAFGRPDPADPDRHLIAQRKLGVLVADRERAAAESRRALVAAASPSEEDAHPEASPVQGHAFVVLAVALVVLVGVAIVALAAPVPSLAVFDRAQTAEEAEAVRDLGPLGDLNEPVFESLRLLAEDDGVVFLAMRVEALRLPDGVGPGICLYSVGHGGWSAACGPLDQVRVAGLSGRTGPHSYSWGPIGPFVFTGGQSDAPVGR